MRVPCGAVLAAAAAVCFSSSIAEPTSSPCIPIDALCPPRAETAARFKAGSYPPAARPYREAAKMAYRYMVSLPAMTALVETGKPNQKYQHNAYVSKTHATHIKAMLTWMRLEPGMRETAMRFARMARDGRISSDELEAARRVRDKAVTLRQVMEESIEAIDAALKDVKS